MLQEGQAARDEKEARREKLLFMPTDSRAFKHQRRACCINAISSMSHLNYPAPTVGVDANNRNPSRVNSPLPHPGNTDSHAPNCRGISWQLEANCRIEELGGPVEETRSRKRLQCLLVSIPNLRDPSLAKQFYSCFVYLHRSCPCKDAPICEY